jgi:hypothetical protein
MNTKRANEAIKIIKYNQIQANFQAELEKRIQDETYKDLSKVKATILSVNEAKDEFSAAMNGPFSIGGISLPAGASSTMTFTPLKSLVQIPGEAKVGAVVTLYFVTGISQGYTDFSLIAIKKYE